MKMIEIMEDGEKVYGQPLKTQSVGGTSAKPKQQKE